MNLLVLALQYATTILTLLPAGSAAIAGWEARKSTLETIQADGRDPTAEEWAVLDAQVAAADAAFDAATKA